MKGLSNNFSTNTLTMVYLLVVVFIAGMIKENHKNKTKGTLIACAIIIIAVAIRVYFLRR